MKKIISIIALALVGLHVQAQSLWDKSAPDDRLTFGLRAGVNFATTDADEANSTVTHYHIGLAVDYNIIKSFSISSGLYIVEKGFKGNYPELTRTVTAAYTDTKSNLTATYLQIPLMASWRIEAPSGVQFHINVGPYFAFGIGGSAVYKPYDMTYAREYDQDTFGDKGFWLRNDVGIKVGIGVLIKKAYAEVSYDYGLKNVAKVYGDFHTRNVNMTIGCNF